MKNIPLTQGYSALVDDEDYDFLMQWKWYFHHHGYAIRCSRSTEGKRRHIQMHRIVNKTPDGFFTDHINRNKLDNRKENLRTATTSQNQMNSFYKNKDAASKYKGVTWDKVTKKWQVKIKKNSKETYIGQYKYEVDAAIAYNEAATNNFGDFACLNKV